MKRKRRVISLDALSRYEETLKNLRYIDLIINEVKIIFPAGRRCLSRIYDLRAISGLTMLTDNGFNETLT